jgi:hypothetical protein
VWALVQLTGQEFVGTTHEAWRKWWEENKGRFFKE